MFYTFRMKDMYLLYWVSMVGNIMEKSWNLTVCFPALEMYWKIMKYPQSFGKVKEILIIRISTSLEPNKGYF